MTDAETKKKERTVDQKSQLEEKKRRRKNDLLHERSFIDDFETNPTLERAPRFMSVTSFSRIAAHRAVTQVL